jgi:hypothetical protein
MISGFGGMRDKFDPIPQPYITRLPLIINITYTLIDNESQYLGANIGHDEFIINNPKRLFQKVGTGSPLSAILARKEFIVFFETRIIPRFIIPFIPRITCS